MSSDVSQDVALSPKPGLEAGGVGRCAAEWKKRDPIKIYRSRLLEAGFAESDLEQMEKISAGRVDEATEEATNSPTPPLEIAYADVWADGGVSWRN